MNWQSPKVGLWKVNMKFPASPSSNRFGLGAVIRGSNRSFLAARAQNNDGEVDPYVGELLVARAGLLLAWDLGLEKIVL